MGRSAIAWSVGAARQFVPIGRFCSGCRTAVRRCRAQLLPEASTNQLAADPQRRRMLAGLLTGFGGISIGMATGLGVRSRQHPVPLRPPGAQHEAKLHRPLCRVRRLHGRVSDRRASAAGGTRPVGCPLHSAVGAASGSLPAGMHRVRRGLSDRRHSETASPGEADQTIGTAEIDTEAVSSVGHREIAASSASMHVRRNSRRSSSERSSRACFAPFVEPSRCTGCGICEHRCPVEGVSAIRVKRREEAELSSAPVAISPPGIPG
jgi:ferredoxin